MAVSDEGLPGNTEKIRHHTVDVPEGKLSGQLKDGESVLEDEEGDVLRP